MPQTQLSTAEVVRRGKEIYERDLRAHLKPEHHGKVLVVDIYSGDYELGADVQDTVHRLKHRQPNAVSFALRIGARSVVKLGLRRVVSSRLIHDGDAFIETIS